MSSMFERLQKAAEEKKKQQKTEEKPKLEVVENSKSATTKQTQAVPTTTNHPQVVPTPTKPVITPDISPTKNFTKVPNSITTEAIPQGMFKGLSKHTYDVLYKLTRGAITPVLEIQLTRLELMKLTGLSENTQRAHIKYLSMTGLIQISYQTGKHEGATYRVFIPEELPNTTTTNPSQVVPSSANYYQPVISSSDNSQKLGPDNSQKLGGVGTTNIVENKDTYENPKTLFKTNTSDDDTFTRELEKFCLEIKGKSLTNADRKALPELASMLGREVREASKRTPQGISSFVPFLIAVVENAFRKQTTEPAAKKGKTAKSDRVGEAGSELRKLSDVELQDYLEIYSEKGIDELKKYEKWFLPEDFTWLMENLEEGNN